MARHSLLRHALWLTLIMALSLSLAIGWHVVGLPGQMVMIWWILAVVMWVGYWQLQPSSESSRNDS